jgi:hypothetical protein
MRVGGLRWSGTGGSREASISLGVRGAGMTNRQLSGYATGNAERQACAAPLYCEAAGFIGVIVGLTEGWATSKARAGFLGFVIALPVAWMVGEMFVPGLPTRIMIVGTLANSLIFGVFNGRLGWRPPE